MMFQNDSLATLLAENYAYCKIWDLNRNCVVFPKINIWSLSGFSNNEEFTRKFLSKVNNRFGLKPGVSIVTIATILLWEKELLPQKQGGTQELCILRGKSWSYRKHWWMIWIKLSHGKGYLAAAPLILHTKGKRLASLSNKGMVKF